MSLVERHFLLFHVLNPLYCLISTFFGGRQCLNVLRFVDPERHAHRSQHSVVAQTPHEWNQEFWFSRI